MNLLHAENVKYFCQQEFLFPVGNTFSMAQLAKQIRHFQQGENIVYSSQCQCQNWGTLLIKYSATHLFDLLQLALPLLAAHGARLPVEAGRELESRGRHSAAQQRHAARRHGRHGAERAHGGGGQRARAGEQRHAGSRLARAQARVGGPPGPGDRTFVTNVKWVIFCH